MPEKVNGTVISMLCSRVQLSCKQGERIARKERERARGEEKEEEGREQMWQKVKNEGEGKAQVSARIESEGEGKVQSWDIRRLNISGFLFIFQLLVPS